MKRSESRRRIDWVMRVAVIVLLFGGIGLTSTAVSAQPVPGDASGDGKISQADVGVIVVGKKRRKRGQAAFGRGACQG
jgi:hypothetical protein